MWCSLIQFILCFVTCWMCNVFEWEQMSEQVTDFRIVVNCCCLSEVFLAFCCVIIKSVVCGHKCGFHFPQQTTTNNNKLVEQSRVYTRNNLPDRATLSIISLSWLAIRLFGHNSTSSSSSSLLFHLFPLRFEELQLWTDWEFQLQKARASSSNEQERLFDSDRQITQNYYLN